ncbi:MAG TPA: GntR family transcriptional regulator [Azospirillum sp.]|nr:GntR family transcriptional regulator [Azospirillum sp.]
MTGAVRQTTVAPTEGPRFQEILAALRADIVSGRIGLGERLPTEQELCLRFRASRYTVREALRRLQALGLIVRRQGSGSVVAATQPDGRFHNSISSLAEIGQYATSTRLEVLAVEKVLVEGRTAELLHSPAEVPWVRVSALRRQPGERTPLCYTEIFLPAAYDDVAQAIGTFPTAVYSVLESRYGVRIEEVVQSIEASSADANLASRLSVEVGTPVLVVIRHYLDQDGRVLEVAVNSHPAGRYRYEMTLQRADGA